MRQALLLAVLAAAEQKSVISVSEDKQGAVRGQNIHTPAAAPTCPLQQQHEAAECQVSASVLQPADVGVYRSSSEPSAHARCDSLCQAPSSSSRVWCLDDTARASLADVQQNEQLPQQEC